MSAQSTARAREALATIISSNEFPAPGAGWIRAIRQAVGVSVSELARKLKVSPATVIGYERGELNGSISLSTMRRVASAFDCEVVYRFQPFGSLEAIVAQRALIQTGPPLLPAIDLEHFRGSDVERKDLIPAWVASAEDIAAAESANISSGRDWLLGRARRNPLTVRFLLSLHKEMFGQCWRSAGKFRGSGKPVDRNHPSARVDALLDHLRTQLDLYPHADTEKLALTLHHGLARIEPFKRGSRRHAALAANAVALWRGNVPPFTWGAGRTIDAHDLMVAYQRALYEADRGWLGPLREFARS